MGATAAAIAFVPVEEYLRSDYEPDVDYVDGYLEDRNVGENQHSDVLGELVAIFRGNGRAWGVYAFASQTVQVAETRYRVPDVCVMPRTWKKEPIIHQAPMLCIEVLSPVDTYSKMQMKCRDYFDMGVPEVWVIDTDERVVNVMRRKGTTEQRSGMLRLEGTMVDVSLEDVFAAMDEGR